MDRKVGTKDTSYKPSAEGKQGRGQTTRRGIGKGWRDTTCRGQRHMDRVNRVHYPLKYPGCLVATSPDAMEVREWPS